MKSALIFSVIVLALVANATPKSDANATPKAKVSKDIRFSGSQVDGKYLSAGESIAEVEGDKEMGALVGVRKNFRDLLKVETARLEKNQQASAQSGKGN